MARNEARCIKTGWVRGLGHAFYPLLFLPSTSHPLYLLLFFRNAGRRDPRFVLLATADTLLLLSSTQASSANTVTDHPREECRPVSLGQGLVIPIDLPLPPRRPTGVSHKSKSKILQSSIKVPEPRNSALLFRAYILDQGILPDNKFCNHQACVSVIIGALWRMLSEEERDIFARLAELEKQEHKKNHPEWRYIPGPRKPGLKSPHKIEIDSPPWKTVALQIARLIRTGVRGDDLAAQINIMVAEIGPNNMSPRKRKRPRYTVDEVPSMSKGSIKHQVLFSPPRRKPIAASGPHSADTAKMRVVPTPVYVEEASNTQ